MLRTADGARLGAVHEVEGLSEAQVHAKADRLGGVFHGELGHVQAELVRLDVEVAKLIGLGRRMVEVQAVVAVDQSAETRCSPADQVGAPRTARTGIARQQPCSSRNTSRLSHVLLTSKFLVYYGWRWTGSPPV